ncbi:epimerase [Lutimaribacter marinistellae]|uniref:Epimerase n=1 Tax=Lutimaribacter marinistellae TaxID=1820329 RepID=A0ABV7TAI7_9RHOB
MTQTALILGSTGRFGRQAGKAFSDAGWRIRRFDRGRDTLTTAAQGADVIVNAWNPQYYDWAAQLPALHAQVIEAARLADATVIVPGNVYVFGADTRPPWSGASPHRATNPLGMLRRDMEEAYRASSVRTILLRAGDFLDTEPSGNWFDKVMAAKVARGRFVYPGNPDIPHAWAFLPDLCRAAVQLADMRQELPRYTDVPFPGYAATGREMASALSRILSRDIELRKMAWWQLQVARPFWKLAPHLIEMRYLWDTPHWLDRGFFDELLPGFESTPMETALRRAVAPLIGAEVHPDQPVAAGV